MDHPALVGANQQMSRFRSLRAAPATVHQGMENQQASHINKAQAPGQGLSAFSSVRPGAYALPNKASSAPAQAIHQMLSALLLHTQMR